MSVPLIGLLRPTGDVVRPLPWTGARARLAVSGQSWKPYDEIERELVTDRVLRPGERSSGIILYPAGTYAYFATADASGKAAYPYIVGPTYYGVVQTDDITGNITVPGNATLAFLVPEPGCLGLLAVAGAGLLNRKRRS